MEKKIWETFKEMLNIMREMQAKASLRFCLSIVRMAYINKTNYSLCWWGCGERGIIIQFWCEYKHVHSLWKLLKWLIRTLRIDLYQGLAITIFGIYSMVALSYYILLYSTTFYCRDTCSVMFITVIFIIVRNWKPSTDPSINEWIMKM